MKMVFLEQFISIRQISVTNPKEIAQFESILNSPSLELGILKPGNVYSTIFQLYVDHNLHSEALQTLNGMKTVIPNFMHYLDSEIVTKLCLILNISPAPYLNQDVHDKEENSEDIREVIRSGK